MSTHFSIFIILSNNFMHILVFLTYHSLGLPFSYAYFIITFINFFKIKRKMHSFS